MSEEIINLDKFDSSIFDDFSKTEPEHIKKTNKKIPVVMISGFLGSGKTTLLNHILQNSPNLKIGAIINDFGKINIDSKLVANNISEQTIELSNGCICCMIGDNGLSEPLARLANETSEIDAILIEASGIAEPYDLLQTLRYSGNEFSYFGGNIYVVDAQNFEMAREQFPSHFSKCLRSSDIIVLNKTDLVDKNQLSKIKKFITNLSPRTLIIESVNSKIDPNLLFSWESKNNFKEESHREHCHDKNCSHKHHIHNQFESISFETEKPLSPTEFINFLDNLPKNLFRMKGFCYFGMKGYEQKYLLQIVGKTIDISAQDWQDEAPKTELVLIGANLNRPEVEAQLNRLIDKTPTQITPENMMNFERFIL